MDESEIGFETFVNPGTLGTRTRDCRRFKIAKYRIARVVRQTHRRRNETWKFGESGGQNVDRGTFGCKMYIMEHGV
jgi:hypothetical protein